MKLKELTETLHKAYLKYGDIEIQTMGGKEDYEIKSVMIAKAKDEIFIEIEKIG